MSDHTQLQRAAAVVSAAENENGSSGPLRSALTRAGDCRGGMQAQGLNRPRDTERSLQSRHTIRPPDGQWLAMQAKDKLGDRIIHLRGFHYALLGEIKPDGKPYTNTEADWLWLQSAAKAARWLGYIPFHRIRDARNNRADLSHLRAA